MSAEQRQLTPSARSILKTALAIVFGVILCSAANATTQIPDEIEFDGRSWPLLGDPLAALYPGMKYVTLQAKLPRWTCTANWRGYKSYWKVEDSRLFLLKVVTDACSGSNKEVPLDTFVPGATTPLLASWATGTLRLGVGRPHGADMDLLPHYDSYINLKVKEGVIVEQTEGQPDTAHPTK